MFFGQLKDAMVRTLPHSKSLEYRKLYSEALSRFVQYRASVCKVITRLAAHSVLDDLGDVGRSREEGSDFDEAQALYWEANLG